MLNEKYFWIVFVVALAVFSTPLLLRGPNSPHFFLGEESYLNLRLAHTIATEKTLPRTDPLSYGGRPLAHELAFPFLLAFSPIQISPYIPLLLLLIAFILLAFLLRYQNTQRRTITLLLFTLSPPAIYLAGSLSTYTLALPLLLATLLAYTRYHYKTAFLLLALTTITSTLAGILLLFLFIIEYFRKHASRRAALLALLTVIVLITLQHGHLFLNGLPELPAFPRTDRGIPFILHHFFAELGGPAGFSFFILLFAICGIYYTHREHYHYIPYYLLALLTLIATLYISNLIFLLTPLVAFLAAITLHTQLHEPWKSVLLKRVVLITTILALLLPTIIHLSMIDQFQPTRDMSAALQWLTPKIGDATVFSPYQNGIYITFTGKKNVMDGMFLYAPNVNERWRDSQTLYHSVTIQPVRALLTKYNIRYILLDKNTKQELWTSDERELPFLLKYSKETFAIAYENPTVTIWEVF